MQTSLTEATMSFNHHRQLSTEIENFTRTGFSGTSLDNLRNETFKMLAVGKDEVKEVDYLTT